MKFICDKNAFQREIAFAQEIISSKNLTAVVSNVYLEAADNSLLIRATDIKIGFETKIPVDVQEDGKITVFCDKLTGILSSIPDGTIEISYTNNKLLIKPTFKKAQFSVKTIASEEFPQLPDIDDDKYFNIPITDFREMISQTVFSVSDDETRFFMNGVFFERVVDGLVMVATDGRRLAFIKKNITENVPEFKGIIVPPKLLSIVLKRSTSEGEIALAVSDKNLFIKFGQYKLSTVLIDGQFPNYNKVIPESQSKHLIINKHDLIDALKRVSLFVAQSRRVLLNISENKLVLSSEESEMGAANEELDCTFEGEGGVMGMNFKYIEEPLRYMKSEEVSINFSDTGRAVTVCPEPAEDYFHILMPMQTE